MATRLLHVSDLHAGTREDAELAPALTRLIAQAQPELIVASGDLSHRAKPGQLAWSARLLRSLGPPVLAIPGNHDIPAWPHLRFTRPFAAFEQEWGTTQPLFNSPSLFVVGLNSVRPWRHQSGGIRADQLRYTAAALAEAPASALRVVVLHHHLLGAPWRSRKKPVARRSAVLAALVDAGAELVLAGHIHQGAVSERREFEISRGGEHGVVVSIAPGLGQPRPKRRGEARGLHIYDVEDGAIIVRTYVWRDVDWALTATRRFPRGPQPLAHA